MRILITGAAGMVGRNLLADPRAQEHEILSPTRQALDLRDAVACKAYVTQARPDLIIHAAAVVGGIQANIDGAGRFLQENLAIGLAIVGAAHAARTPRLINLASSCIYPKGLEGAITEDRLLTGALEPTNEGYALAKLATWKLAETLGADIPGALWRTLVPPNLYGRWDHFDARRSHMIAAAILKIDLAAREGRGSVEIWGDGEARREFLFAADLADFVWSVYDRLEDLPPTLNVGVGEDRTVNDYYHAVAGELGYRGRFEHDLTRPVGVRRKLLDVSGQARLGWAPKTALNVGVAAAVGYYRAQRGG